MSFVPSTPRASAANDEAAPAPLPPLMFETFTDPARATGPAEQCRGELRNRGRLQPQRDRVAVIIDQAIRQAHAGCAIEADRLPLLTRRQSSPSPD